MSARAGEGPLSAQAGEVRGVIEVVEGRRVIDREAAAQGRVLAQQRARVGAAFQFLQRKLREIEGSLLSAYHLQAEVERHPEAAAKLWSPARARRLQELWMMRQDLAGFVVLGDPAAELPI